MAKQCSSEFHRPYFPDHFSVKQYPFLSLQTSSPLILLMKVLHLFVFTFLSSHCRSTFALMSFVEKCGCESCVFVLTASSVFLNFKFLSFFALLNSPFHDVLIQEAVFKRP